MEEGHQQQRLFLEPERIPVFIGSEGKKKEELEYRFDASFSIDSETGEVTVATDDALTQFILGNVIHAVNLGHNPDIAMQLSDETYVFDVIDVKHIVRDQHRLKVVMGRIIGKEGRTRELLEELSNTAVSVKDHYVSVVGPYENTMITHEALMMLIKGASHKAVYSYLERSRPRMETGVL